MTKSKIDQTPAQRRVELERGRDSDDLIRDTAAVYTCSYEIADDYASQCSKSKEEFEIDVIFTGIAHEIWKEQPGKGQQIASALADLLAARNKYLDVLTELLPRFEDLIDPENHEHLEPIGDYRKKVHRSLFPEEF